MENKYRTYYLVCIPESFAVEKEVNKILRDNPNGEISDISFQTAPVMRKTVTLDCPACHAPIVPNKELNTGGKCLKCKLEFDNYTINALTKVQSSHVGTFYLVSFFINEKH